MRYQTWFIVCAFMMSVLMVGRGLVPSVAAQSSSWSRAISLPKSSANDRVPVVITLKNVDGIEHPLDSNTVKSQRRQRIKNVQNAFLTRQKSLIKSVKRQMTVMPVVVVEMTQRDMNRLRQDSAVLSAMIDEPVPPTMYESVLLTGAGVAHTVGATGSGTSVAVLDTGVAKNHPFLSGQVVSEACFSTANSYYGSTSLCPGGASNSVAVNSALPCPESVSGCSHGTHVAGTIAGKRVNYNGQSMSGIAPDAKIIAVQVFSRFPASVCGGTSDCVMSYTSDQVAALDWLYLNRTTTNWQTLASVNMSLGGGKSTTACDTNGLKYYVDQLRSVGVATVIASGNNGYTDGISAPACISSAIAVGASTLAKNGLTPDVVASFSNAPLPSNNLTNAQGDRLLDMLAPGYWVVSSVAYPSGGYAAYAGTSMATPHVAGAWALMKSVVPSASVAQVLGWLTSSGVSITDTRAGINLVVPRMQVDAAVRQAMSETMPTATLTSMPTATLTSIPSATPTSTPSATVVGTSVPTTTIDPNETPIASETSEPTQMPSMTATATQTYTATATITPRATGTKPATVTPSATKIRIHPTHKPKPPTNTRKPWVPTRKPRP